CGRARRLRFPARAGGERARAELHRRARHHHGHAQRKDGDGALSREAAVCRAEHADDRSRDPAGADARPVRLARRSAGERRLAGEGAAQAVRRLDLGRLPDHGARRAARRRRPALPRAAAGDPRERRRGARVKKLGWTLGVFAALVLLLAIGLRLNPREVPSPLIGKPAPSFELPLLQEPDQRFNEKQMLGRVWILNVWASWCPPCLVEHPVVTRIAKAGLAPVIGLNYKDARDEALPWLERNGNPYQLIAYDREGRIGIDYGVYGVPETYVIDRQGVIRFKRIGPLSVEVVQQRVEPLV